MSWELFRVLDPGLGATIQDRGRRGWRRFGVPPGGVMDDHAAGWANRLLENPPEAPVVEILCQGARFKAVRETWIAVTGADADASIPTWRSWQVRRDEVVQFPRLRSGVWLYLAVAGGLEAGQMLGSASPFPRGPWGKALMKGDVLAGRAEADFRLPSQVAGRIVAWTERRHYDRQPALRVWPGPQWSSFSELDRARFFREEWTVTARSDRAGYRLSGPSLKPRPAEIISEPVLVGSVQIPENGQPIITLRDGPTVGGYPKLGVLDADDVSRLVQCGPGRTIRFRAAK